MANIKITVEGPLMDGHRITFKAPCDCSMVEKLDVRYMEGSTQKSKLFTMKDSLENDLTGVGNLFTAGAYVSVVLNPNDGSAYLLNANTSVTPVDNLESDRADLPLSARQGKILNDSLGGLRFGVDGDGNYGYYGADDSLIPFKRGIEILKENLKTQTFSVTHNTGGGSGNVNWTKTIETGIPGENILYAFCAAWTSKGTNCKAKFVSVDDNGVITYTVSISGDCYYSTGREEISVVYYE